jgi:lysophospholipase
MPAGVTRLRACAANQEANMIEHDRHDASSRHRSGRVKAADDLELVWQAWTPEEPRGAIVIVHGLAEHSGRYRQTAEFLAANGWAVFTGDLRGHGLSPDVPGAGRVHVKRFTDYFNDVQAFVGLARETCPGLPLFLLGHSMGGLITIRYVLERPAGITGAIISSPALGTHPDFQPPLLLKVLVGILSRLAPKLLVKSELDTNAICRDPAVVRAYEDDPLVSQKVSARWYAEMMKSMKIAQREARSLSVPVLLMQSGADRLVDPSAPGRWAAATPPGRVEQVTWDGFYHEMLNEPEKDRVRQRILDWLGKIGPAGATAVTPESQAGPE